MSPGQALRKEYDEAEPKTTVLTEDVMKFAGIAAAAITALEEAERRMLPLATTSSDSATWYRTQARQNCRAMGIEEPSLDWEA